MGNIPTTTTTTFDFSAKIVSHDALNEYAYASNRLLNHIIQSFDELLDASCADRLKKLAELILDGEPLDSPENTVRRLKAEAALARKAGLVE